MTAVDAVVLALLVASVGLGGVRWLRVAQREHYVVGEATSWSLRWWQSGRDNAALGTVGAVAAVACALLPPVGLVTAVVAALGPRRLGLRGRTSRLVWTRRLATVAVVSGALVAIAIALGAIGAGLLGAIVAAAISAIGAPAAVDLALAVTRPIEDALANRFVKTARARLERVRPLVIGITGSYGKTTVKGYVAHLLGPYRTTLPSPKSFNNRAGLARTVNELLGPATEVLVAEMGTYGPGEIAAMCSWLHPEISVITAIGPAHLQRFKSLERTLAAKAEITEGARVVVLNCDDERLAGLATVLERAGKRVIRASGSNDVADVAVLPSEAGLELRIAGHRVGEVSLGPAEQPSSPGNAACAAAVAVEVGVPPEEILARLASLPVPPNRLNRYLSQDGYVVFDDTFNSNPRGALIGLSKLQREPAVSVSGRRVVVTPGIVELGPTQAHENAELGEAVARVADVLVVVARTNRRALTEGASRVAGGAEIVRVDRLDQGLDWVRSHLGPGDAVLYENDLPDHYP